MFVRKSDSRRVYYKGIVRPGDDVPEAVAEAHPGCFEWIEPDAWESAEEPAPTDEKIAEAWTMTEADLDDDDDGYGEEDEPNDEPFEGYGELSVRKIMYHLEDTEADREMYLAVRDYELHNRNRVTLIREIDEALEGV